MPVNVTEPSFAASWRLEQQITGILFCIESFPDCLISIFLAIFGVTCASDAFQEGENG
jgi:hypothetical protein